PERPASPDAPTAAGAKPSPPPARGAGTLVVRSTPTGAGVTINGRWRGRTPLTLDELPYARYNVRVVQPGYTTASDSVTLSSDEPSRSLSFRLRAQATPRAAPRAEASPAARPSTVAGGFTGSIYVDSRPRGAKVSINGKPVGVTPLRVPNVRIGSHVVRLELPDHRIWSSSARVTSGEEARVTGSLERIQ
ncbi:MAG: PEGA domain-containing protein, partial [Vicinamibacterales bacterium]